MNIRRGEVYLAGLDPVIGSEIAKTRPVVVVSNDLNNEFSRTVTVLPITSGGVEKVYPFEVFLSKGSANLPKNSKAKANQIRTLDRSRLVRFIGELPKGIMAEIDKAIMLHLDLD
jgi:mRNA interferase MazF